MGAINQSNNYGICTLGVNNNLRDYSENEYFIDKNESVTNKLKNVIFDSLDNLIYSVMLILIYVRTCIYNMTFSRYEIKDYDEFSSDSSQESENEEFESKPCIELIKNGSNYSNDTIPITSDRPIFRVHVNNVLKTVILFDSGSSVNAISNNLVGEITKLSKCQIPKIKYEIPTLYGINGNTVKTNGIIMLDVHFPDWNFALKRVPFVILTGEINTKLILGSNTLSTRRLILSTDENGFKLSKLSDIKNLLQYNIMEIANKKEQLKIEFDNDKPIILYSSENKELNTGETIRIKCHIGESLKNNLKKVIYHIDDPFVNYYGLAESKKNGMIEVLLCNPGPPISIIENYPLGRTFPINDDDIEIFPVPTIYEMHNTLNKCKYHLVKCICDLDQFKDGKFVTYGLNNKSTFFISDFDYLITDPEWIKFNSSDHTSLNYLHNYKDKIYFVIRELYTVTLKQLTIILDLKRKLPNLEIICIGSPCIQHVRIVTNQLQIYISSWLHFNSEFCFSFNDIPRVTFECNQNFTDNHNSVFSTLKLFLHVPIFKLTFNNNITDLIDQLKLHFLSKSYTFIYQGDITSQLIQDNLDKHNFINLKSLTGDKPTHDCEFCSACYHKNPKNANSETDINFNSLVEINEISNSIAINNANQLNFKPQYEQHFPRRIAKELHFLDIINEPFTKYTQNTINSLKSNSSNEECNSIFDEQKLEDTLPEIEIGSFTKPESNPNWREQIDLSHTDEDDKVYINELITQYEHIFQKHPSQKGKLKYDYKFSVKFDDPNVKPFSVTQFPIPPLKAEFLMRAIESMIENGMIKRVDVSESHLYYSPIMIVNRNSKINYLIKQIGSDKNKINEAMKSLPLNSFRIILDTRRINSLITDWKKSSIYINDFLQCFNGFSISSVCDLSKAYPSLLLDEESQKKFAFKIRGQSYVFLVPPQGVSTLPMYHSEIMAYCLKDAVTHCVKNDPNKDCFRFYGAHTFNQNDTPQTPSNLKNDETCDANQIKNVFEPNTECSPKPIFYGDCFTTPEVVCFYVDDIIAISRQKNREESKISHRQLLKNIFECMSKAGLILSPSKCQFGHRKSINILGFEVTRNNFKPLSDRYRIFENIELPVTRKDLYRYLGLVSYLRGFCPDISTKLSPLYDLLSQGTGLRSKINYNQSDIDAFNIINRDMKDLKALNFFNPLKTLILTSD